MKKLGNYLLSGLLVIAPLAITLYAVVYLFTKVDSIGQWILHPFWKEPIPGLGIVLTLLVLVIIGYIGNLFLSKKIVEFFEGLFNKLPLTKMLYNAIKDVMHSLLGEKKSFSQVVLLYDSNVEGYRIGFLTAESVTQFELGEEYVAVYIPQGLQVSGDMFMVKRERVKFVNTPVDEAMKFCLSAGIAGKGN